MKQQKKMSITDLYKLTQKPVREYGKFRSEQTSKYDTREYGPYSGPGILMGYGLLFCLLFILLITVSFIIDTVMVPFRLNRIARKGKK